MKNTNWYKVTSFSKLEAVKDESGYLRFKVELKEGATPFEPRINDVAIRVDGEFGYLAEDHDYDSNYLDIQDDWERINQVGIYAEEESDNEDS